MPQLVTIPISNFAVAIRYVRPVFQLWIDRAAVIQGIFDGLEPWKPSIDDMEVRADGKPSEQGITLKLPLKRITFFFGPASCKFSRDDADWGAAEETITILDAVLSALTIFGHVTLGNKSTAISLHIQPRTIPFMDILNPFVPCGLAAIESQPIRTMATVAKWENRKVTIDGSGALANGVFLRMERDFDASVSYDQMAQQLREDEAQLFSILGVEEDKG
jgi:hypothetical protein